MRSPRAKPDSESRVPTSRVERADRLDSTSIPAHVSLSRARYDAQIFTDSCEELSRAISRTAENPIALDAVDGAKLRHETSTGRVRSTAQFVAPPEPIARPDHAQRRARQEPKMRM